MATIKFIIDQLTDTHTRARTHHTTRFFQNYTFYHGVIWLLRSFYCVNVCKNGDVE